MFSILTLSFDAPSAGNPLKYQHKTHREKRVTGLSSLPIVWIFIQIFLVGSKTHVLSTELCNGRSRSSKVTDFGTDRKHVCNFLLLIYSNLCLILTSFTEIAGFLLTPPLFHPNFGYIPLGLDCRCCGSEGQRT